MGMKRWSLQCRVAAFGSLLGFAATSLMLMSTQSFAQERFITVASTTSTEQSGLFKHLLPMYQQKTGVQVREVACDITTAEGRAQVLAACPQVDILVNNAGIHIKKPAVETTPEEFQSVLTTHVCAAHALTRAVLPGMIARKHGSILLTASMTSLMGMPLVIAYSAAKSAYVGMTRALAAEVSPDGVRVNAIAPGWIESPMLRKALSGDEKRSNKILSRTPMARFGEPDDIGWAAVYLCSPAAKFVTGVVLPIDGGASIGF